MKLKSRPKPMPHKPGVSKFPGIKKGGKVAKLKCK